MLNRRQWFPAIALLLLIAAAGAAFVHFSSSVPAPPSSPAAASGGPPVVDLGALHSARRLGVLASSPEEQRLAQQAVRVADHEVDLAFAGALWEASQRPPQQSDEIARLRDRITQVDSDLKDEEAQHQQRTARLAAASPTDKDALQEQITLLEALRDLDQEDLADARQDLMRAGGDPEGDILRLRDAHEAAEHDATSQTVPAFAPSPSTNLVSGSLLTHLQQWFAIRSTRQSLEQQANQALASKQALTDLQQRHEVNLRQQTGKRQQVREQAHAGVKSATTAAPAPDVITDLRHFTNIRRTLANLKERIQDEKTLGETYKSWAALVAGDQRASVRNLLRDVLGILVIILLVYFCGWLVESQFAAHDIGGQRRATLRSVVRYALQFLGVMGILLIVLGVPSQLSTVLGLAGAGLTVALKDFIVGFFGWFVLMGRNGLRVGDWVEIEGVTGEVAEVGLLRTVLLETGNWTDAGHPTGRKVAFVNSFAIEGHFFNFSTAGQWLWDELQVLAPPGEDLYALIDETLKVVTEATEANAHLAEEEWQRSTTHYRLQSVSATPALSVRPTREGIEIRIRYIARAAERLELRTRLYQQVVELLHKKAEATSKET